MTSTRSGTQDQTRTRAWTPLAYWAVTAPFLLIFGYSAVWTLVDPAGTLADTTALGFPEFTAIPLGVAKLLGLAAILWRGSRVLTGLAFAGFFYDVVLALSAHLVQGDLARAPLAAVGIAATVVAFWAYRRRYPTQPVA